MTAERNAVKDARLRADRRGVERRRRRAVHNPAGESPIPGWAGRSVDLEIEHDSPTPAEPGARASRCCGCGRPVWPAAATESDEHPAAPELCDYCAAAVR
jgi:hypothetical protein